MRRAAILHRSRDAAVLTTAIGTSMLGFAPAASANDHVIGSNDTIVISGGEATAVNQCINTATGGGDITQINQCTQIATAGNVLVFENITINITINTGSQNSVISLEDVGATVGGGDAATISQCLTQPTNPGGKGQHHRRDRDEACQQVPRQQGDVLTLSGVDFLVSD